MIYVLFQQKFIYIKRNKVIPSINRRDIRKFMNQKTFVRFNKKLNIYIDNSTFFRYKEQKLDWINSMLGIFWVQCEMLGFFFVVTFLNQSIVLH